MKPDFEDLSSGICELCGKRQPCGHEPPSQEERLELGYGFKPLTQTEKVDALVKNYEQRIAEHLRAKYSDWQIPEYNIDRIQENDDACYFPIGWIGCSGFLVEKASLNVLQFGSYIGAKEHVWAYYRGFSFELLGADRLNDLTITKVNNHKKCSEILRQIARRNGLSIELLQDPPILPFVLRGVDLYFEIRNLMEAERENWLSLKKRR
jgi:hypothetical protein